MAKLIFNLKDVPEQEADAVRQLLEQNQIEFYETHAGRWKISVAALWIPNDQDFEPARNLINQFQYDLGLSRQQEREQDIASGNVPGWWQYFVLHPLQVIVFIIAIFIVLAVSTIPFIRLG